MPTCRDYTLTSDKVKWCDVKVGQGDAPLYGDLVVVDFNARAQEVQFDSGSNYAFSAGKWAIRNVYACICGMVMHAFVGKLHTVAQPTPQCCAILGPAACVYVSSAELYRVGGHYTS